MKTPKCIKCSKFTRRNNLRGEFCYNCYVITRAEQIIERNFLSNRYDYSRRVKLWV